MPLLCCDPPARGVPFVPPSVPAPVVAAPAMWFSAQALRGACTDACLCVGTSCTLSSSVAPQCLRVRVRGDALCRAVPPSCTAKHSRRRLHSVAGPAKRGSGADRVRRRACLWLLSVAVAVCFSWCVTHPTDTHELPHATYVTCTSVPLHKTAYTGCWSREWGCAAAQPCVVRGTSACMRGGRGLVRRSVTARDLFGASVAGFQCAGRRHLA